MHKGCRKQPETHLHGLVLRLWQSDSWSEAQPPPWQDISIHHHEAQPAVCCFLKRLMWFFAVPRMQASVYHSVSPCVWRGGVEWKSVTFVPRLGENHRRDRNMCARICIRCVSASQLHILCAMSVLMCLSVRNPLSRTMNRIYRSAQIRPCWMPFIVCSH